MFFSVATRATSRFASLVKSKPTMKPRALREALGAAPNVCACYRFATKLRAHSPVVEATLGAIVSALRAELPEYGKDIARRRERPARLRERAALPVEERARARALQRPDRLFWAGHPP
jgi:hypothetical protein